MKRKSSTPTRKTSNTPHDGTQRGASSGCLVTRAQQRSGGVCFAATPSFTMQQNTGASTAPVFSFRLHCVLHAYYAAWQRNHMVTDRSRRSWRCLHCATTQYVTSSRHTV